MWDFMDNRGNYIFQLGSYGVKYIVYRIIGDPSNIDSNVVDVYVVLENGKTRGAVAFENEIRYQDELGLYTNCLLI